MIWVMNAPSTDALSVGVAYVPDAQVADFQTVTYDTIMQNRDVVVFTRKQTGPVIMDFSELKSAQFKKYNTESDTTSTMSKRASYQGIVYGFYNASDTSATTVYGEMLMEFELQLYNRTPDYGFTLVLRDPLLVGEIARLLQAYVENEIRCAERAERRKMMGGWDQKDEKLMIVFNQDPAWRAGITNKLLGRYESQLRDALQFAKIKQLPRDGPGPGAVAKVSIVASDPGNIVPYEVNVDAVGHMQGDIGILRVGGNSIVGLPVPVNVAQIAGSTTTHIGGLMSIDVGSVGGGAQTGTVLQTDTTRVGGSAVAASGGVQTINGSVNATAVGTYGVSFSSPPQVKIVGASGGNVANVSTSGSLQTVVSATESKGLDEDLKKVDDELSRVGLTVRNYQEEFAKLNRPKEEFADWVIFRSRKDVQSASRAMGPSPRK